jgi:hypothetical protein
MAISRVFPAAADSEIELRDGKPFIIYALVCPITLEVKYVGQTADLNRRTSGKAHSCAYNAPFLRWVESLGYLKPYRVILERGINRRVTVKSTIPDLQSKRGGRRPTGLKTVWLSSCMETKWLKRFCWTILNTNPIGSIDVNQLFTNPPLPWDVLDR